MRHAAVGQLTAPPAPSITPEYLSYNKGPRHVVIVATPVSIALSIFLLGVYTRIKLLHFLVIDEFSVLSGRGESIRMNIIRNS
jgi:hypothetical protein